MQDHNLEVKSAWLSAAKHLRCFIQATNATQQLRTHGRGNVWYWEHDGEQSRSSPSLRAYNLAGDRS